MRSRSRPLSPHLQIYKVQLTSFLSIMHRVSGLFLITALIGLAAGLCTLAAGPLWFKKMIEFYQSWMGKMLILSWGISIFYHGFNGVRHLIWDVGYGYELLQVYKSGWSVLLFTVGAAIALGVRLF